ncbi:GGDEF domain-containing response regulator [Rhizobium sp. C4]|uniref:GGDEF domain-containing response regulator n=1 Tax=Rhizobium sp. C4 TaxID=1349800 RepID=UPI001E3B8602|nr:diguanylate cyclase [Rhizobium sp. C4]MCD2173234.1 diguanylate cyclase [Rhizobium sp. C4]
MRTAQIRTRGGALSGSRPCVLIVEDTRTFTTVLAHRFETELAVDVVTCHTLHDMKRLLSSEHGRFMLAVIDLNLEDSPNGEVLDYSLDADLPTIVFTASFDFHVRECILKKNVVDYVLKDNCRAIDSIVNAVRRVLQNRNIRVLVAEGFDPAESEAVQLLQAQQFLVTHAQSLEEAVDRFDKYRDIELVIVDDALPGGGGVELIKQIRRSSSADDMRIIGFSTRDNPLTCASFLKAGASDFLYHPFVQEEFQCRVAQSIDTLARFKKLQAIASRDFLTDTYNRRYFFERGPVLVQHCLARQEPCCAVVLDIDHFKKFNDTYGHETGDLVLKTVARKLRQMIDGDMHLIARLGGEEFAILLRNMDVREATEYCDLLREEIARTHIVFEDEELSVNVSIGVAVISAEETFDNYLHAADQYLYMAKNSGRNRVFSDYSITQLFAERQKAS